MPSVPLLAPLITDAAVAPGRNVRFDVMSLLSPSCGPEPDQGQDRHGHGEDRDRAAQPRVQQRHMGMAYDRQDNVHINIPYSTLSQDDGAGRALLDRRPGAPAGLPVPDQPPQRPGVDDL